MSTRAPRSGRAVTTLADFRPQRVNANKHTQRGLGMLDAALSEDGYVAPMTAAASREIIDGSARLERAAERFGRDVEPIVVEHDGRRPIVMVRTDIPSADTELATRISLRANRIAQADLAWSAEELAQIVAAYPNVTKGLWTPEELAELAGLMAQAGGEVDAPAQIDKAAATQKPLECMARPMRNHDAAEVYDPFCGSGTTIIAATQLGRRAYCMEIDPGYCAVILDRYARAVGTQPVLLDQAPDGAAAGSTPAMPTECNDARR
jgi:hypothetical protein